MQNESTMRYHPISIRTVKWKTAKAPNTGKDAENMDHSHAPGRNIKWQSHCGRQFDVFFKNRTQHTITIWPSNCTLAYLSHVNENLCSCKNVHPNVHSSFFHSYQKLETTHMSINRWLIKQTVAHTGYHVSTHGHGLLICRVTWSNVLREYAEGVKAIMTPLHNMLESTDFYPWRTVRDCRG